MLDCEVRALWNIWLSKCKVRLRRGVPFDFSNLEVENSFLLGLWDQAISVYFQSLTEMATTASFQHKMISV